MQSQTDECAVVDVETAPWREGVERLLEDEPEHSAPSNWKDPDKIAAEVKRKAAAWRESVVQDAALSPFSGEVFAVAAVSSEGKRIYVSGAEDEPGILQKLAHVIEHRYVVTWNGVEFDAPFLVSRYLRHGIPVPEVLQLARRYRSTPFLDLRGVLTGWDRHAKGTLSDWCWYLGIEPPVRKSVAEIRRVQDERNWKEAASWALSDTRATAALLRYLEEHAPSLVWGEGR